MLASPVYILCYTDTPMSTTPIYMARGRSPPPSFRSNTHIFFFFFLFFGFFFFFGPNSHCRFGKKKKKISSRRINRSILEGQGIFLLRKPWKSPKDTKVNTIPPHIKMGREGSKQAGLILLVLQLCISLRPTLSHLPIISLSII